MRKTIGLLLGAAAVYGIYRYSKLSTTEKNELKGKGKDLLDKYVGDIGNLFGRKATVSNGTH